MRSFIEFWIQLLLNIESFAEEKWNVFKTEAVDDAKKFLTGSKEDIERWTQLLKEGKITIDDLTWLIKGKKDQAELMLLKQKGLSKPELETFFEGLLQTILSTTLTFVL